MIVATREVLRTNLSPRAFDRVCRWWWVGRHWAPRLVTSLFERSTARVQGFPEAQPPALVDELRRINMAAPTNLCRLMTRHGSDKGRFWHNYTIVYSALFRERHAEPLRIFEPGIGTDNPNLVSTMGEAGWPGASLRGWREHFPKALVYGADIDRDILFEEDRLQTFFCDQLDREAIHALWAQPVFEGGVDIIVDDGLHTYEGNISFLDNSLPHVRPGGFYIVEDIIIGEIEKWRESLETIYSKRYPDYEFAFVELPNPHNRHDNNLLIIRRRR